MAIAATDIFFYYPQVTDETADNYGGTCIASTIGTEKNALWDDVSGEEAANGDTEYRKVFVGLSNSAGSQILSNVYVWIASETPAEDIIFIKTRDESNDESNVLSDIPAYDGEGETTTAWIHPTAKSDGVFLGTVGSTTAGAKGFWLCRYVPAGAAAYANNSGVIRIEGETA